MPFGAIPLSSWHGGICSLELATGRLKSLIGNVAISLRHVRCSLKADITRTGPPVRFALTDVELPASLRANGSRECAPDDRLRKAIHSDPSRGMDCFVAEFIIGPAEGRTRWLLAMTAARFGYFTKRPTQPSDLAAFFTDHSTSRETNSDPLRSVFTALMIAAGQPMGE